MSTKSHNHNHFTASILECEQQSSNNCLTIPGKFGDNVEKPSTTYKLQIAYYLSMDIEASMCVGIS